MSLQGPFGSCVSSEGCKTVSYRGRFLPLFPQSGIGSSFVSLDGT